MAQKFTVPITVKQLNSASSDAVSVFVDADTHARLKLEAGGRLVWGDGTATGDVNLYRDSANTLKTDDKFVTAKELASVYSAGDEGGEIQLAIPQTNTSIASSVAIDIYQNKLRIYETGGSNRGAYIDITAASNGVGSNLLTGGGGGGATTLDGLNDVTAPSPSSGDFLKWNGSAWVNDPINLATDTVGNYVASLVAGTGITVTNNSGEGATPTVAIDDTTVATLTGTQTLSNKTLSNPTILGSISLPQYIIFEGSVDDAYETVLSVVEPTADRLITLPNRTGTVITDGDTGTVTSTMIADGTIVNGDISTSAGIALSKLATSTPGNIIVYNSSGVPTSVTETGDITISDTGVTAIASGVIVNADINSSAAIAHSKLANATPGQVLLGTTTSGVVTATTISGDITIDGAGVATIAANSVALGTDTTGNYVSSLVAGTGITITNNSGESATPTIAVTSNTYDAYGSSRDSELKFLMEVV